MKGEPMNSLSSSLAILSSFTDYLFSDIRCADDKAVHLTRNKKTALERRYVYPNNVNSLKYMCFDMDLVDIEKDLEIIIPYEIQPPNLIIKNPESGHSHFVYCIKNEIHKNKNSSKKALKYYESIYKEMTRLLADIGCDEAYKNHIIQNPFHKDWQTTIYSDTAYELKDLARNLDLSKYYEYTSYKIGSSPENEFEPCEGQRNNYLFRELQLFAFSEIGRYRPHNFTAWSNLIYKQAETIYNYIESKTEISGFSINDVRCTAKSVLNWVWERYTIPKKRGRYKAELSLIEDLKDKQSVSAMKTNEIRRNKTIEAIKQGVKQCRDQGIKITQTNTARICGLSTRTIKRYKDVWLSEKNSMYKKGDTRCISDSSLW
jgi:hypothetical protein